MEKPAFHLRTRKRRKLFTIRIDPEVLETAKELGLNISRTCEECLKQTIQQRDEKAMRKLVTIRIDSKIWQTAREIGLNISKTCENILIAEIQRLTTSNCHGECIPTPVRASQQPHWSLGLDDGCRSNLSIK